MGRVSEIEVTLPHPALSGADWADGWQTTGSTQYTDARHAAETIVRNFPVWTMPMLAMRQLLVWPFGMKGSSSSHATTEKIGIFPIVSERADQMVAGFDDRHLDFRIVVDIHPKGERQSVSLITVIKRHNIVGRIYLQMVLPFHRAIIRSALSKL